MKSVTQIIIGIALGACLYYFFKPKVNFNSDKKDAIQFYRGSFNEAIAKAKHENKNIFIDIYATWCGPCKMLKQNTFTDKNVGTYFNNKYINVAYDAEKGEGLIVANKFGINSYPTTLFLDTNGTVLNVQVGYLTPSELLEIANKF